MLNMETQNQMILNVKKSERMDKVKVGIIGCGMVSAGHANGYLEDERAKLVAVCDLDRELLKESAQRWGIRKKYQNYKDLLNDEEVDAVDICTPPYLHHSMTLAAAEARKHIIVEKPMCASVKQADEMISSAKKAGVLLMVGESYVFTSTHMRARELIDQGMIGKPEFLTERHGLWLPNPKFLEISQISSQRETVPFRDDPQKSLGGLYRDAIDHFPHAIATARYLMQDAKINKLCAWSRSAVDRYGQRERILVGVMWKYDGGDRHGTWLKLSRFDQPGGFSTTISGNEGSIDVLGEGGGPGISGIKQSPLVLHTEGKAYYYRIEEGRDARWISDVNYYDMAHRNEVHHFLDCIVKDKKPRYSGEDGKMDLQLTLTAIKSAVEEKPLEPNELPDDWTASSQTE